MNTSARISVIIVNRNGARYLSECLGALYVQRLRPAEILIIDNASTDDSLAVIEMFRSQQAAASEPLSPTPELRVIRNADNTGFCCANNQGIRSATGDFILLLNADVTLEADFLAHLSVVMQAAPAVGLAVGKLLNYADRRRLDSTGLVMSQTRRASDRGQGDIDAGQYDHAEEVFGASAAACLCRRAMLEDLRYADEYFDDLFFAYKEDVDLSWRARLFGWTCVYAPQAWGWHHRHWGAGKRREIPRHVRRHSLKNRYLMLLKNEHWSALWPALPAFVGFELLSLAYIVAREPYLLAAFLDVARAWPTILKKRRHIQRVAVQRQQRERIRTWFV
jgi:GT2 family glycosyltransferase